MTPSLPNDQRPDMRYSCRLAAGSAQARLDLFNSQPLAPQILSRAMQLARSPPVPSPCSLTCRSSQPSRANHPKPHAAAKSP
jgi:hypothetical protein